MLVFEVSVAHKRIRHAKKQKKDETRKMFHPFLS